MTNQRVIKNALQIARRHYSTDGSVPYPKFTSRTIAENWTPPEDVDPRLGKFMEEYPAKMAEGIAGIPQAIWDTVKYPGQLLYGEKQFDTDEAVKKAVDITGAAMTGSFPFARAAAGEAVLGSGPIRANAPATSIEHEGSGIFRVRHGGEPAGTISVAKNGSGNFVSAANLDEPFIGRGIGSEAYNLIENEIGRKLAPSPLGISPTATKFWQKRLKEMSPEDRSNLFAQTREAGASYNLPERDVNMRLYGIGGPESLPPVKTNNPRIDMDFRDVTKRVPELQEAAPKVASGEMSSAQYQELVNKYKPVSEWASVPKPASYEEMSNALRSDQVANIGKGGSIPEGHPVGLRLDIPAYRDYGVWVPTIHDKIKSGSQPVMTHEPTALISNAVFSIPENKALNVAKGGPKSPFATINGQWVPFSQESATALAQQALKDKNWRQVGMDPERHSHFYDRATQQPIIGAEQVLQVGPLVLAKNPQYGSKKDFKYKSGGPVVERALVLLSKKVASRRGRPD